MGKKTSTVNWKMLVRVIGWLLFIEAAFMLFPLLTSLCYGDSILPFAVAIPVTLAAATVATVCVRPKRFDMGKREGFMLTALVWVVFSVFGMIPFMLCSTPLSLTDAFFESMSGFTTTGASVLADLDMLSHGIHLWRSLMQWIGGMGIILFTLAVLPMLNSSGGMQMFNAEVTGITHEKLRPRVSSTAKRLWLVYMLLTIALIVLYWLGPMNMFDSICHALSTMSTGGFSTKAEALSAWNSRYIKIVTTVFMFIGGVNFALIFRASTGQFRAVWSNEVFRFYVWVVLGLFLIFDVSLLFNDNVDAGVDTLLVDSLFQIVSTISSTGYAVEGVHSWGPLLMGLLVVLMFVGACAGSTSGGAKLDRILMFWKNSRHELTRCIYPNHIMPVEINHKVVSPELVNKTMAFLTMYTGVILLGGLLLTACGAPLEEACFTSYSCVSNSALDTVLSTHGGAYSLVTPAGKWILSLLMLTGRLEIFTVLVLFVPRFWSK